MADNFSSNFSSFQKRWNVTWDDKTAFLQFKNRLFYLIEKHLYAWFVSNKNLFNQYAYYCGLSVPYPDMGDNSVVEFKIRYEGLQNTIIYSTIANSQLPIHIAWYLQNLFVVLNDDLDNHDRMFSWQSNFDKFYNDLIDLLSFSPIAQIQLSKMKNVVKVYPAGAKLLDEVLVNENLKWLSDYPESFKSFEQSLSFYLSGDKSKIRNLIDNLRVALEQLLRKILNNKKSIENQKKELADWLETKGVQTQIKQMYSQLLFGPYTIFQNDAAKHGDEELLPEEIEYMIYLTGTFMRLLIQLDRNKS